MITYDPVRKTMVAMPPYGTLRPQAAKPAEVANGAQTAEVKGGGKEEDFFDHLLDVVNPLQHLPVIGSIYRAATGDKMGAVEKIAGDALYGGLWGAVTAVADVAFEAITGKSVENTVMAWFDDGDDTNTSLASIENTVTGWFDGGCARPGARGRGSLCTSRGRPLAKRENRASHRPGSPPRTRRAGPWARPPRSRARRILAASG